ncbi:hypothetical protein ABPG74_003479 [Tetrahymena malaccensis]
MVNFLDPTNSCGQNLLKLVARGSTILAEMQRLSENIPKVFYENSSTSRYKNILFDFDYFKNIDTYEDVIQKNPDLVDLDELFKSNYMELLQRFYILFESIYLYHKDLNVFIEQVQEAVYIQYSFEVMLADPEGKKLITEAFYLFGCMLLLMERLIIGPVRERIVIAFYRYSGGQSAQENINYVIKLTANTGFLPAQHNNGEEKRPLEYPDFLFDRFPFKSELIDQILYQIKEQDIYKHKTAYPDNDHRSFAYAAQASMAYVLLYFVHDTLNSKKKLMREIVDKHFYDNWVIAFYLGYTVDLTSEWARYNAAKEALGFIFDLEYIPQLVKYFQENLTKAYLKCKEYLNDGVLNEEYVLDKIQNLLSCLRECNITVRWLMLHKNTTNKKAKAICDKISQKDILQLLLLSSKFEEKLKTSLKNLIDTKVPRWEQDKKRCCKRMEELTNYFGGSSALQEIQANKSFEAWFTEMKNQIERLSFEDITYAGRKIKQLTEALDDIEQYNVMSENIQIKQYLLDTKKDLKRMVRIVNIQEEYLTHIDLISDITYSWQSLQGIYVINMQDKIKKNPQLSLLLKTTFMKLSSILNTPMVRIVQSESDDLVSVSKFYSGLLIKFVKNVLQIIPISVFDILQNIINLLTNSMKKLPPKLKKEELKEYLQPEDRSKMADYTYKISLFTESILSMEKYLIGVIEVNPKEILDDGIRKELIKCICKQLDQRLIFQSNSDITQFQTSLFNLAEHLSGFKRALEYIQDFIGNFGLKIFHEEFDRLILTYIDMEQIAFVTNKLDYEELLYDDDIPMPDKSVMEKQGSVNFMGRLLRELMRITDYRQCVYVEQNLGFYHSTKGTEIISLKTMDLLYRCVGVSGLNGLDQLFSFMIASQIRTVIRQIKKELNTETKNELAELILSIKDLNQFTEKFDKQIQSTKKIFKQISNSIQDKILKIGQMVLLRRLICLQLQIKAKVGSNRLYLSLETLNDSIINDILNRPTTEAMNTVEAQEKQNELLFDTTKLFSYVGISDPIKKVYLTTEPIEGLSLMMLGLLLNNINQMDYCNQLKCLIAKKSEKVNLEPNYLLNGIIVFMNQFHPSVQEIFTGLIGYFVKSSFNFMQNTKDAAKNNDLIADLIIIMKIYEEYSMFSENVPREFPIDPIVPIQLVNEYRSDQKRQ